MQMLEVIVEVVARPHLEENVAAVQVVVHRLPEGQADFANSAADTLRADHHVEVRRSVIVHRVRCTAMGHDPGRANRAVEVADLCVDPIHVVPLPTKFANSNRWTKILF